MVGARDYKLSPWLATSEGAHFLNKKSMPVSGAEMYYLIKVSAAEGFKDTLNGHAMPCSFPDAEPSTLS